MKKNSIKKKFAPKIRFRLTGDSVPDDISAARIEISGRSTVTVEGCRSVLEYDCESITFSGTSDVRVIGKELELREFDGGVATVKGEILSVEFVRTEEK